MTTARIPTMAPVPRPPLLLSFFAPLEALVPAGATGAYVASLTSLTVSSSFQLRCLECCINKVGCEVGTTRGIVHFGARGFWQHLERDLQSTGGRAAPHLRSGDDAHDLDSGFGDVVCV